MGSLLAVALGLALLGPLFVALERRRPAVPSTPAFSLPARRLDLAWWAFSALCTGTFTRVVSLGLLGALTLARGAPPTWPSITRLWHAHGLLPWRALPWWAQLALLLLCADLLGYASHRLRHARALWAFHSVHHSASALDAMAAARMHPLDDLIDNTLVDVLLLLSGADPVLVLALSPLLFLHTLLTHANLPWGFGAWGKWLVSPRFHRWHHALDPGSPARGCNFAGMFALWDRLFGTYYMPDGIEPQRFGLEPRDALPEGLFAQLAQPPLRALRALGARLGLTARA